MTPALARIVLAAAPALLAAGCASSPASVPAWVTLFGPGARLETWRASVIDGEHIHSGMTLDPCTMPALTEVLEKVDLHASPEKEERIRELSKGMGSMMEAMMVESYGKAHGGRNRRVVVLRHFAPGSEAPDQAVVVDLPALKPGEAERLFKAGEFQAFLERPPQRTEALLERGWVRATQLAADRIEFDLFLVFKPARPDAGYETAQVVTRVEWPSSR